jgi:hypothetical protein
MIPVLRKFGMLAAAALLATAIGLKPATVHAMGTESPPPSDDDNKKKDKKGSAIEEKEQQLAQEKFLRGYRAARERILAGDYQAGIAAMHALGHDEHPDVANYIGYANRKPAITINRKSGTRRRWLPIPATCAPGPITACGTWNRATASRPRTTSPR